jgi:Putative DNA-binding domain
MPTLAEIQLLFRDAVVQGDTQQVDFLGSLLAGGRCPERRLIVHQRNYRQSLVDALLLKFPATGWLLGTQVLTEAATRFIREYPPQAPCIAEFGAGFPNFLSQCPAAMRAPYVREFAELEWYVGTVAIAVGSVPATLEELSSIQADALPDTLLKLQPGLHYLSTSWPVDELMELYLSETVPDRFELSPAKVDIEVRGARGEFHFSRLDPAEATFRKAISEGHSIGEAAESALEVNAGFDPGKGLVALVGAGLIQAIRIGPDESSRL